jgi:Tol biopolymer transport system component
VLFYSDRDGDDDVYMMRMDGGGIQQITDEPGRDYEADITPDGRTLVVASQRASGSNAQLFLMDADGSNVRRLTFSTEGGRTVTDDYPHWSPDGRSIVFQRSTFAGKGVDADVWLIDAATGEERQLTDTPDAWDSTPGFAPDGGAVLFESNREGDFSIYRLDLATMELTLLTDGERKAFGGKEAPHSRRLLFTSDADGDAEIFVQDADGSNGRQLTDNDTRDQYPHWSPDGKSILFESSRDGNREVYVMNGDGSNQRRITNDPGKDADPHWIRHD